MNSNEKMVAQIQTTVGEMVVEFWEETAPLLERMFLLSASDRKVMEAAAVGYQDWREADSARDRRAACWPTA